jgi:geranylgeranyl reductase family protein
VKRWDVIVAGGGPAGSTAARELGASGARVLVVDRAIFPRYKACGGGVPLRTARLLPFPIDSVVERAVDRIEVTYRGRPSFKRRAGETFAHMVMRDRFDSLLLDYARTAGAEFRPGTVVREVDLSDGVTIRGEDGFAAEAEFLVCADGAHSPVGRRAGLGAGIAECAAWEVEVARSGSAATPTTAVIDLGYDPWGYAWLFPKDGAESFGVILPRDQAASMKALTAEFIARRGAGGREIVTARGHKIRFRRGSEPIAGDRALLVGDSAGLADEFTGEGIFYAVESGRIAARALLSALGSGPGLAAYEREVDRLVMPELRAARLIAYMFFGMLRRAPKPWLFASAKIPLLWDAFFAVQRGDSTYAREVERVPILPSAARHLMHRP